MANTTVFRAAGPTYALSVTASSHTSVTINDTTNDQVNFASFLNLGANSVAVTVSALPTAPASVLPVDGSPTATFILPPLMTYPFVFSVPTTPFSVSAIGSSAGPALVYILPVGDQS